MVVKSKYKPFISFQDNIYKVTFLFLISDEDTFKKACLKYFKKEPECYGIAGKFVAWCHEDGTQRPTLWLRTWQDDIAIHECIHAAIWVLTNRGVKFDYDNDETIAYYVSWIFNNLKECYEGNRKAKAIPSGLRNRQKTFKNL